MTSIFLTWSYHEGTMIGIIKFHVLLLKEIVNFLGEFIQLPNNFTWLLIIDKKMNMPELGIYFEILTNIIW